MALEKINGWWVDQDSNGWDADLYTEEQAQMLSKTLAGCWKCRNCKNCVNCQGCENCKNCAYCWDCRNCQGCRNCWGCHDYVKNPQLYRTGEIGWGLEQTCFYFGEAANGPSLQVVCGWFHGNLEEFAAAVEQRYCSDKYSKQYRDEIEKVKTLWGLE